MEQSSLGWFRTKPSHWKGSGSQDAEMTQSFASSANSILDSEQITFPVGKVACRLISGSCRPRTGFCIQKIDLWPTNSQPQSEKPIQPSSDDRLHGSVVWTNPTIWLDGVILWLILAGLCGVPLKCRIRFKFHYFSNECCLPALSGWVRGDNTTSLSPNLRFHAKTRPKTT